MVVDGYIVDMKELFYEKLNNSRNLLQYNGISAPKSVEYVENQEKYVNFLFRIYNRCINVLLYLDSCIYVNLFH